MAAHFLAFLWQDLLRGLLFGVAKPLSAAAIGQRAASATAAMLQLYTGPHAAP